MLRNVNVKYSNMYSSCLTFFIRHVNPKPICSNKVDYFQCCVARTQNNRRIESVQLRCVVVCVEFCRRARLSYIETGQQRMSVLLIVFELLRVMTRSTLISRARPRFA